QKKIHAMFSTSIKSGLIRSFLCISFLIQTSCILQAQVLQKGRVEIGVRTSFESFSVVSLDSSGIALYRNFSGPTENQLELIRLDTALNQVYRGFLPVPKGFTVSSAKVVAGKLYFLLENKTATDRIFQVFAVQVKDGSYLSYPIRNIIAFNATEFIASKKALLIGGYFNFRPVVLFYSLKDHRSRILPGFLNEPGELTQIIASDEGDINVIVSGKNNSKRKCLWIRHFDEVGDLTKTVVLESAEKKDLIFGRAAKADNGIQVIAGVYGRNSTYSRGIFVAEVNTFGEYVIRYYNFADLHNFFHYMKAKREKRIKERIERRKIRGKKTKFNYRFLVHELIPYGDQFLLVGEAFYPTYSSAYGSYNPRLFGNSPWSYPSTRYSNNPYLNRYSNPNQSDLVFTGFQYTHAIVIGFDAHAKLTWDNSFEINGLKSFYMEQFVKILTDKEKIELFYLFQNNIRSKVINNSQIMEGTGQDPILVSDRQKKSSVESSKLEHWYGNHLFVYGIQAVKNGKNDVQRSFFINKLIAP
ncbi:MAG TPA: hypothetical protein VGQ59_10440, partial [Cyclobacteriaceae bacterium]|nr:hypothetical protein [Cyclobacteriaceae bacterium]